MLYKTPSLVKPLFYLFALMLVHGVAHAASGGKEERVINVVASFSIIADWARVIGGEHVSVYSLVGPDQDAHVFRVSPRDVRQVAAADLLLVNGLGFEGWMDRLIIASGFQGQLVVLSEGVQLLSASEDGDDHHDHHGHGEHDELGHHDHGQQGQDSHIDPHAWHSISAAKVYTRNLASALETRSPHLKAEFRRKLADYHKQLDALKAEYQQALSSIPAAQRQIVVPHNSFAYLGREFDLHIDALQGVSTEADTSARDLARIVDRIRNENVRAIFMENVSNPRLVNQIERETNVKVGGELISDALSVARANSYLALMRHNLSLIVRALAR